MFDTQACNIITYNQATKVTLASPIFLYYFNDLISGQSPSWILRTVLLTHPYPRGTTHTSLPISSHVMYSVMTKALSYSRILALWSSIACTWIMIVTLWVCRKSTVVILKFRWMPISHHLDHWSGIMRLMDTKKVFLDCKIHSSTWSSNPSISSLKTWTYRATALWET